MRLETAILLVREFSALDANVELFRHYGGDCIVKVRAPGVHFITDELRKTVDEIAYRIYKHVDMTCAVDVVMMT